MDVSIKLRGKNTMSNSGCCQLLCPTKNSGENWFNKNPFRVPKTLGSSIIPGLESKWLRTATFLTLHPSPFTLHPQRLLLSRALATWPVDFGRCPNETWAPLTHPPGVGYLHGVKKRPQPQKGGLLKKNRAMINQNLKLFNPKKKQPEKKPNSKKPPTQTTSFNLTWSESSPKKHWFLEVSC